MYKEPTLEFIVDYLSKGAFGTIKPSEMEIILFYILLYHKKDLDMSEFDLAEKYLMTDAKANRLKVEIAKRFTDDNTEYMVKTLGKRIFEDKTIEIEWDKKNNKINIPIYDPSYLRAFKKTLEQHNIPYDKGNNARVIKLTVANFIGIFCKCYDGIRDNIKDFVKENINNEIEREKLFKYGIPLDIKAKKFLTNNLSTLISLIQLA